MERDGLRFTVEQRQHMREVAWHMWQGGKTQSQIAVELQVSQSQVCYWLQKMKMLNPRKTPAEIIAARIRGEMVCCDIYQRFMAASAQEKKLLRQSTADWHTICFHGEWAAQLALREYP